MIEDLKDLKLEQWWIWNWNFSLSTNTIFIHEYTFSYSTQFPVCTMLFWLVLRCKIVILRVFLVWIMTCFEVVFSVNYDLFWGNHHSTSVRDVVSFLYARVQILWSCGDCVCVLLMTIWTLMISNGVVWSHLKKVKFSCDMLYVWKFLYIIVV